MDSSALRVIIVGAGLAGLAAAVTMRREGHEIFERSQFANEVGAAISCPRNVTRILSAFGYEPENLKPVVMDKLRLYACGNTDGPIGTITLAPETEEHNFLAKLSGGGKPCVLHLATPVQGCDPKESSITLSDGRKIKGDVIIVSDGIHSPLRSCVLGKSEDPTPSGFFAYRFLIPANKISHDPLLNWLMDDLQGVRVVGDGKRRIMVTYACRNGTLFNCACIFHDKERAPGEINMDSIVPIEKVLEAFNGYHEQYITLIKYAKDVFLWPLYKMGPLSTWVNERTCLIGDAAHAMFPHGGQGGAQAIEDAATLGVLLPHGIDKSEINERLQVFERIRKPRCSDFQTSSHQSAEGLKSKSSLVEGSGYWKWAYDYDAMAVARDSLSKNPTHI